MCALLATQPCKGVGVVSRHLNWLALARGKPYATELTGCSPDARIHVGSRGGGCRSEGQDDVSLCAW